MMNNLTPKESGKKDVFRQLFPPDKEAFYKNLQSDEFKKILVYNATTSEGRNAKAKYFRVDEEWKNGDKAASTSVERYFLLLLLVKKERERHFMDQFY